MQAKIIQSNGYFVVIFQGVEVFKTDVLGIARTVRDKYNRKTWNHDPDCSTWNSPNLKI